MPNPVTATRRERLRRLRALGRAALVRYRLGDARLSSLRYGENVSWRVLRPRDRKRFLLRVHTPRRSRAQIRSELIWLDALKAAGFDVPVAIRDRSGQAIQRVALAGAADLEPRDVTLLTWTEGRLLRRPGPRSLRLVGAEIARLHRHAETFRPPRGFTRPVWDPDTLRSDPAWSVGWKRLAPPQRAPFCAVARRFSAAAAQLGRGREVFGLLHGDFSSGNVLFRGGRARFIDFDDCGFGYFLYDLATLLDRLEWRPNYPRLRAALLAGYRRERGLPPEHEALLDLFLLVRWTFLGLAYLSAPEDSPGRAYSRRFLGTVTPKMRKYLRQMETRASRPVAPA
jgi:Ser/Thr protein kinase RdoA (MazF antagonist)